MKKFLAVAVATSSVVFSVVPVQAEMDDFHALNQVQNPVPMANAEMESVKGSAPPLSLVLRGLPDGVLIAMERLSPLFDKAGPVFAKGIPIFDEASPIFVKLAPIFDKWEPSR